MRRLLSAPVFLCCALTVARAQFSPRWLQDEAYWGDGKAEFNVYDAREVRYGEPRPSEVIHIFVRESFSPTELVKTDDWKKPGTFPALKLNQIVHVPTGLEVYQQMHSSFWRTDSGALIKATLTSNDSCGNTYKEIRALSGWRGWLGSGWSYQWRTYWEGMSAGKETMRAPEGAVLYDELPMRVRTIDFAGLSESFTFPLGQTMIHSKKGALTFDEARLFWTVSKAPPVIAGKLAPIVEVVVQAGSHIDEFQLDRDAPHLLLRWRRRDGSVLRLQKSRKIDYWNYNQPGDRERAFGSGQ